MDWLETRIPPPVVMFALAVAAWFAAGHLPTAAFYFPGKDNAAFVMIAAGVALNLWPKLDFRRAGTTANPLRPASSTQLVTSGVYRYTRNPMYLGHALILFGWSVYLGSVWTLIAAPIFVLFITRFQIRPEERVLAQRFPEFKDFRQRVPRWL